MKRRIITIDQSEVEKFVKFFQNFDRNYARIDPEDVYTDLYIIFYTDKDIFTGLKIRFKTFEFLKVSAVKYR